jgi:hypothetical protein
MSTEGAAPVKLGVPRFQRSTIFALHPGLTAGPINCRSFGPEELCGLFSGCGYAAFCSPCAFSRGKNGARS